MTLGQMTLFPSVGGRLKNRLAIVPIDVWQARPILEQFHYLHRTRTGRQINYAVMIDGIVDGVITYAYPMMSASLESVPADELVEFARLYLHQNIPHSASCAIGKSLRVIKKDWSVKFPDAKPLRLVVSWSDTTRHVGTVYKAANFEWLRRSRGVPPGNAATSKRGARVSHDDYNHDKDCWIYWLK